MVPVSFKVRDCKSQAARLYFDCFAHAMIATAKNPRHHSSVARAISALRKNEALFTDL